MLSTFLNSSLGFMPEMKKRNNIVVKCLLRFKFDQARGSSRSHLRCVTASFLPQRYAVLIIPHQRYLACRQLYNLCNGQNCHL
jgi:hypothetical protein